MSTQKIREVLEELLSGADDTAEDARLRTALAELEAIERAATDLRRLGVGDFIYKVREARDHARDGEDGSGWNHPDVEAWGNATDLLGVIAAQRSGGTTGAEGTKAVGANGAHE